MATFTITGSNDILTGTSGDDVFNLPDLGFFGSLPIGFSIFGGTISGGDGIDTLRLLESSNANAAFADGPTTIYYLAPSLSLSSIERIQFASTAGQVLSTLTPYGAFGCGIPATIELVGGAGRDHFVLLASGPGSYVMPNFNLTNWQGNGGIFNRGDSVVLLAEDGFDPFDMGLPFGTHAD